METFLQAEHDTDDLLYILLLVICGNEYNAIAFVHIPFILSYYKDKLFLIYTTLRVVIIFPIIGLDSPHNPDILGPILP